MPPKSNGYSAQLATLVKHPPDGDAWLHEIKYDGYRLGVSLAGGRARLISRRGNDWTRDFPPLAEAAARLPAKTALVDGEAAIELPDGRTDFQSLQNAIAHKHFDGLVFFAFDLLELDGKDLRRRPLEERKRALQRLLARAPPPFRYAPHWVGGGPRVYAEACRLGFEGIVSKRRREPYRPGRNTTWVKTKCTLRQEFVIGGFTDPDAPNNPGIGSLLVGVRDKARLRFAGKVGTGFTQRASTEMRQRLERLAQPTCPFTPPPPGWLGRHGHWVKPTLVAEVAFTEWTQGGVIRHPSYQGLRSPKDKPAREVTREAPAEVAGVRLSSPDRVLFSNPRLTKLDLARFYEAIADFILPHLEDRPLTLVHCPEGADGPCTFMKHSKLWAPDVVRRVRIREKHKLGEYLIIDDLPALIGVTQMDVLELHTWNSRFAALETPDRIVFDLDPGQAVPWRAVIASARTVRDALAHLGLKSWVKTTGGAGLHVVVPLAPERDWSDCLAFSRALANLLAREHPDRFTTRYERSGRDALILLDYLRNNRTNTSIAAYSTRARPSAPLSIPLEWDELSPRLKSDRFTVSNVLPRLKRLRRDPWFDALRCRQKLPAL